MNKELQQRNRLEMVWRKTTRGRKTILLVRNFILKITVNSRYNDSIRSQRRRH